MSASLDSFASLPELKAALQERGHPVSCSGAHVLLGVKQGQWSDQIAISVTTLGILTLSLPMPFRVSPDRDGPTWKQIGLLNAELQIGGFTFSPQDRTLRFKAALPVASDSVPVQLLLDMAQTCLNTSSRAMPVLAAAAIGHHASAPVQAWLFAPIQPAGRLSDSLFDPLAKTTGPRAKPLDWTQLSVEGVLGRIMLDPFTAWLAGNWVLILVNERCVGVWSDGRAWALGEDGILKGDWDILDGYLQLGCQVVHRAGLAFVTGQNLAERGLELKTERILIGRALDGLRPPDENLRLVSVVPGVPLPELALIVPELPAMTSTGTWMIIELDQRPIGLALVQSDPITGLGSLGFFGLAPSARGLGLGAPAHRLLLYALSGLGCQHYLDATLAENDGMQRIFSANACREQARILTFSK